jgi:hypothetical protein
VAGKKSTQGFLISTIKIDPAGMRVQARPNLIELVDFPVFSDYQPSLQGADAGISPGKLGK